MPYTNNICSVCGKSCKNETCYKHSDKYKELKKECNRKRYINNNTEPIKTPVIPVILTN